MMDDIINELTENAKSENWDKVDTQIPNIIQNPQYVRWAYETALTDMNKHVRDLGASILEKATISDQEFKDMRE